MSSRTEAGAQPNSARSRSNRPATASSGAAAGSRWRGFVGSLMARRPRVAPAIGVGDAEPRQSARLHRLHRAPPRPSSRGRSRSDAGSRGRRDGGNDRRAACPRRPPRAPGLVARRRYRRAAARRAICAGSTAGKDSTLVGLSLPRQRALSARTCGVVGEMNARLRRRARSATPLRPTAAAIASRASLRAGSAARQRGDDRDEFDASASSFGRLASALAWRSHRRRRSGARDRGARRRHGGNAHGRRVRAARAARSPR